MEFKGTKGKWSVVNEFRRPQVATDISKDIVCQVSQVWTKVIKDDDSESSVGQSHNEMMSTSKLIAAAPELLEALQEILKGDGAYDTDKLKHASNCIENMKSIAKQAINKALK